ncbi:hypothetical protein KIH87_13985 [Paraneptunicella aestuarii]|uniref:hypothetical protein n=1 Tax=Paraneptunicella aestuarii TaxID=2831148 RepID=UPI001E4D6D2F|nr:hypothetical protein [Paraneptunicella aestuarii]UAA37802.1 hypothetical protein KIH87_13985 [Paraneptunicella aestuarii]
MSNETRTVRIANHARFPIQELIVHHFQYTGSDPNKNRYNEKTVLFSAKNSLGNTLSLPEGGNIEIQPMDGLFNQGDKYYDLVVNPSHRSHWNVAWRCAEDDGIYYLIQDGGKLMKLLDSAVSDILKGIKAALKFFEDTGAEAAMAGTVMASVHTFFKNAEQDSDTIEHKFHGDSTCRQDIHLGTDGDTANTVDRMKAVFNSDNKKQYCSVQSFGFGSSDA